MYLKRLIILSKTFLALKNYTSRFFDNFLQWFYSTILKILSAFSLWALAISRNFFQKTFYEILQVFKIIKFFVSKSCHFFVSWIKKSSCFSHFPRARKWQMRLNQVIFIASSDCLDSLDPEIIFSAPKFKFLRIFFQSNSTNREKGSFPKILYHFLSS